MINFSDVLVLIGMFALRFGVPLAITVGLAYLLKRLDRRWEEEAWAQAEKREGVAEQPAQRPDRRPAKVQRVPIVDIPRVPQPLVAKGEDVAGQQLPRMHPCWELHGCSEGARKNCAACQHPEKPCWQARLEAEGAMPAECVNCDVYRGYFHAQASHQSHTDLSARKGGTHS